MLWKSFLMWLKGNLQSVLLYGGIALMVTMVVFGVHSAGRTAEKLDALRKRESLRRRGDEIARDIKSLPPGGALDELRQKWSR